tara:strand:- start:1369 stop:1842 length:474 start_codon:yes stop_codon:yes gene_type:complete
MGYCSLDGYSSRTTCENAGGTWSSGSAIRQYGYYVKGNKFALIEKDTSFDNNVENKDFGPGAQRQLWKSPQGTIENGIEIQYVYSPENLKDEDDVLDLPPYLAKALVYYVKARLAEDVMNMEVKEYFMREFKKMVEKHESSKISGPRIIVPGSHGIR